MKYPHLAALVPAGEQFDESALTPEGAFVSLGHIEKVEKELKDLTGIVQTNKPILDKVSTLEQSVATLTQQLQEKETALTAANEKVTGLEAAEAKHEEDIAKLNSTIAKMATGSSGAGGTRVLSNADPKPSDGGEKKAALNDPSHPLNRKAAAMTRKGQQAK